MIYVELDDISLNKNERIVETVYRFSKSADMSGTYEYKTNKQNELYGLSLDTLPDFTIERDVTYYADARYIIEPGGMQKKAIVREFTMHYNDQLTGLLDNLYRYPAPEIEIVGGYKGEHTLFKIKVNVEDTTMLESIDIVISDIKKGKDVYISNIVDRDTLIFHALLEGNTTYLVRASIISTSGLTSPFGTLKIKTTPYTFKTLDILREKITFRNQGNDTIEFRNKPDTVHITIYDTDGILLTEYDSSDEKVIIPALPVDVYKIKIEGDGQVTWVYSSESCSEDYIPDWLPQPLPYILRKD